MFTLYVDESGHAGINYLDANQPFHVAAGVLVRDSARDRVRGVIEQRFQNGEVKGSSLLKSPRGRRRAHELLTAMYQAGAVPFFVVMERRFSLAGRLVDTFLDPAHQPLVDWLPTSAIEERRSITEKLAEQLDASVLDQFAVAFREPSAESWRPVLVDVIGNLKRLGERKLALAFEGALGCLPEIVQQENYGNATAGHTQHVALNLPALMHLLRLADAFVDGRGPVAVVHDEQAEYGPLFTASVEQFTDRTGRSRDLLLPDGTRFRGMLRNIATFTTADSAAEPLLQGADMLAATVARVVRTCNDPRKPIDKDMKALAVLTMPALLRTDDPRPELGGAFARESVVAGLLITAIQASRQGE